VTTREFRRADWKQIGVSSINVRHKTMKPWKGTPRRLDCAFAFFIAVSWPHLQICLPFLGCGTSYASCQRPLALVTLFMALFLSFPSLCPGPIANLCRVFALLVLIYTFYVSPVAAIIFLFIGVNIIRETTMICFIPLT
jgi:hypothetical protein